MDIGLKKPLSLKISSPCSGLEAAGSLWAGQSLCVVRSRHSRYSGMTCIPSMPAKPHLLQVSTLGERMLDCQVRAQISTRFIFGELIVFPFPRFYPTSSFAGKLRGLRNIQDELWHQSVCSWCFINWFN